MFLKNCYWSIRLSIQVLTANITFSLQPKFPCNLESSLDLKTCLRPCEVIHRLDIDIANGHRQVFGLYASKQRRWILQDLWHDAVAQLHGFAQNPETQQKSAKGRFGGVVSIDWDRYSRVQGNTWSPSSSFILMCYEWLDSWEQAYVGMKVIGESLKVPTLGYGKNDKTVWHSKLANECKPQISLRVSPLPRRFDPKNSDSSPSPNPRPSVWRSRHRKCPTTNPARHFVSGNRNPIAFQPPKWRWTDLKAYSERLSTSSLGWQNYACMSSTVHTNMGL